eukprot:CAMPEP_0176257978 /NCGR_PEP_ID=MMETSP0121_2-20121125/38324_1 /TAXON_ID=160619 /ORGANISM="Kryptoperidinium foliaceum, Strain CCMP 1326" /LENGTH=268 /DNA_ID=CAMNT_0017597831 /DNA_START=115 /DNA_END=918 /DNA_ORIENTATION=+
MACARGLCDAMCMRPARALLSTPSSLANRGCLRAGACALGPRDRQLRRLVHPDLLEQALDAAAASAHCHDAVARADVRERRPDHGARLHAGDEEARGPVAVGQGEAQRGALFRHHGGDQPGGPQLELRPQRGAQMAHHVVLRPIAIDRHDVLAYADPLRLRGGLVVARYARGVVGEDVRHVEEVLVEAVHPHAPRVADLRPGQRHFGAVRLPRLPLTLRARHPSTVARMRGRAGVCGAIARRLLNILLGHQRPISRGAAHGVHHWDLN